MGKINQTLKFVVSIHYTSEEEAVLCEKSAKENLFNAIEIQRQGSMLTPLEISADWLEVDHIAKNDPKARLVDFTNLPVIKDAISKAIIAVQEAADEANVSPTGFSIDSTYCDCGEIQTDFISNIISEAGSLFGQVLSNHYNLVVNYICSEVSDNFIAKDTQPSESDRASSERAYRAVLAHSQYANTENGSMEDKIGLLAQDLARLCQEYSLDIDDFLSVDRK